jgi:hypothetical protein
MLCRLQFGSLFVVATTRMEARMVTVTESEQIRVTVRAAGKLPSALTLRNVATVAGGYTLTRGTGGWIADDGHLVTEASYTVVIVGTVGETLAATVILVGWAHSQGEQVVMVEQEPVRVSLYSQEA